MLYSSYKIERNQDTYKVIEQQKKLGGINEFNETIVKLLREGVSIKLD